MLDRLPETKPDAILNLMAEFRADPRDDKIDLGVGVYKDSEGRTTVMRAVKEAERRLLASQDTKVYVGPAGDMEFNQALGELLLGDAMDLERYAAIQVPGGSGAIRVLCELIKRSGSGATVWVSRPTWPNHLGTMQDVQLPYREYAYFDASSQAVDIEAMCADLNAAKPGDVVLLHGCCHNPTGADLTLDHWERLTALMNDKKLIPFVDVAYLGFGEGLDEDAAGVRHMAARVDEMLIAISCSKNFGLYRERTGCAVAYGSASSRILALETMKNIGRVSYSMPPDHGAALVRIILADPELRADWEAELTVMRNRLRDLRAGLAAELQKRARSDRFAFLADQKGMFTLAGARPEQVAALKSEHGIYAVGDGRINVAGLPEDRLDVVAQAFMDVGM